LENIKSDGYCIDDVDGLFRLHVIVEFLDSKDDITINTGIELQNALLFGLTKHEIINHVNEMIYFNDSTFMPKIIKLILIIIDEIIGIDCERNLRTDITKYIRY
jgi:hypothetical protein